MADNLASSKMDCEKAMRRVRKQHENVSIDLSFTKDRTLTVNIRGRKQDVSAAKASVLRELVTQVRMMQSRAKSHLESRPTRLSSLGVWALGLASDWGRHRLLNSDRWMGR